MIDDDMAKKLTEELIMSIKQLKLNLDSAKKLIAAAENTASKLNIPVCIAIVDDSGNLIAQHKMDNALLISISASLNKAYTAIALKLPTSEVYELVQPGKPFYGLESIEPGRLCVFGGGIPIIKNGHYIGAIGISGGTSEQDILIAQSAISSI